MSSTLVQPEYAGFTDMGIPRSALAVETMPIGGWAEHKGKWCGFRGRSSDGPDSPASDPFSSKLLMMYTERARYLNLVRLGPPSLASLYLLIPAQPK